MMPLTQQEREAAGAEEVKRHEEGSAEVWHAAEAEEAELAVEEPRTTTWEL
jgi:hypothetical protein